MTTTEGTKVPQDQWGNVHGLIIDLASTSKRSNQPAIYGMVAQAEVERLRTGADKHRRIDWLFCVQATTGTWRLSEWFGGMVLLLIGCPVWAAMLAAVADASWLKLCHMCAGSLEDKLKLVLNQPSKKSINVFGQKQEQLCQNVTSPKQHTILVILITQLHAGKGCERLL